MPRAGTDYDLAVNRLTEDLNAAIDLRICFYQRQMDLDYRSNGGTVYYAIDANILHSRYTHPIDSTGGQWILNRGVFQGPAGTGVTASERQLFEVVYEYLLSTLRSGRDPDNPLLLLLPGHSQEGKAAFQRSVTNASGAPKSDAAKEIETHFLQLDRLKDFEDQENYLNEHNDDIHRLLRKSQQPHDLFREYVKNLSDGRFRSLSKLYYHKDFRGALSNTRFNKSFWDFDERYRDKALPRELKRWRERVKVSPGADNRNDLLALTALDKINRYLSKSKIRVVLITNSVAMQHVGTDYYPLKHADDEQSTLSFSDLYIRSPKSFLFDEAIILPNAKSEVGAMKHTWSDVWLNEIWQDKHHDLVSFRAQATPDELETRVKEQSRKVIKTDGAVHSDIFEKWCEHVETVNRSHNSTSPQALRSVRQLLGESKISKIGFFDSFAKHMELAATESWNGFFLAAAQSGFDFIGVKEFHSTHPRRRVPTLLIIEDEQGCKAKDIIYSGAPPDQIEEELFQALAEMQRPNIESDYLETLIYSLLFALAERWYVARTVAERAVQIAKKIVEETDRTSIVSGREAYYLAAVLNRMCSETAADLENGRTYLADAISALDMERETETPPSGKQLTGLRFDCEHVAIDTAKLFFKMMTHGWDPEDEDRDCLVSAAEDVLRRCEEVLQISGKCRFDKVRSTCEMNIRTNIFSAFFILDMCGAATPGPELLEHLKAQHDAFETLFPDDRGEGRGISHIDMFAALYMAARLELDDTYFGYLRKRISRFETGETLLADYSVMPYDETRFERMFEVIADSEWYLDLQAD